MKTTELPVGAHVAFDVNQQRDNHTFVEAYVVAHRPRGNKSSYWGSKTGNHDTIGIMYAQRWSQTPEYPQIRFEWVRPQNLHMTWNEYQAVVEQVEKRNKAHQKERNAELKDRSKRIAALPVEVTSLFRESQIGSLRDNNYVSVYINIDFLERLVKAAQEAHPAIKNDRIASEVEAALALLG